METFFLQIPPNEPIIVCSLITSKEAGGNQHVKAVTTNLRARDVSDVWEARGHAGRGVADTDGGYGVAQSAPPGGRQLNLPNLSCFSMGGMGGSEVLLRPRDSSLLTKLLRFP